MNTETKKQHLGDCVYADVSGDCIVLTTEDVRIVNTIYLNREVVSRRDNETYICPACGQDEAFEDVGFIAKYAGAPYWKEPTK